MTGWIVKPFDPEKLAWMNAQHVMRMSGPELEDGFRGAQILLVHRLKDRVAIITANTDDGRKVLDSSAGLWCVNAGHGRREIADAVHRQLLTLDYSPAFQMGHPKQFELAARLLIGPYEA